MCCSSFGAARRPTMKNGCCRAIGLSLRKRTTAGRLPRRQFRDRRCTFDYAYILLPEMKNTPTGGRASFAVDSVKEPKRITISGWQTPGYELLHGIYKFDADRLTIAYRIDGPAPEKFESPPGSGVTLLVMEKAKPAKLEAGQGPCAAAAPPPPVVTVVRPVVREISDYADFTGMITAREKVEIRAEVTGTLLKVYFHGGASVKQGDLLAEIDPRTYQAEVDKREANVRLAQARLAPLTAEAARVNKLFEAKAVSATNRNQIVGQLAEAQAALQVAQKELEIAKLNLGYAKISAPIAGKISQPELDPGNMVVAGSTRLATTLSQGPVYVDFNVDESVVSRLRKTGSGRTATVLPGDPGPGRPVQDRDFPYRGQIESNDPEVNLDGTVRCRAVLPNSDGTLLPGMAVRVRLVTSAPQKAPLVLDGALRSNQGKRKDLSVGVVNNHDIVETRAVKLGCRVEDGLWVVTEGLTAQDWVISPAQFVRDGMTVQPQKAAGPASPQPPHR